MNCRYIVIENSLGKRKSYGVAAVCDYEDVETVLKSFVDVCSDREATENFVSRCNTHELSILHFNDAVEDFLAEI